MNDTTNLPKLAELSAKLGQLIRSNELKMAGKLLATARGHLHQLAQADGTLETHYERIAELRNELMEPASHDFDANLLLVRLLDAEKELHKAVARHPHSEPLLISLTALRAAAAIVLVYAQDMAAGAPLDF